MFEIPNYSKLQTFDKNAFSITAIYNITIPSELIDLKEGWCCNALELTKIIVSPNNPRYRLYENKIIIGKTTIEQSNYDCLIFCVRNIKHIKIPSFIEHICSYSFDECKKLESIEFSNDSKTQTIDERAFSYSTIKSIRLLLSVTFIGKNVFDFCRNLEVFEIPDDSKLQTIDERAFFYSSIDNLTIPSELDDLKESWCDGTRITKISVSPNNPRYRLYENKMIIGKTAIEQSNYDCLVFCVRNIKRIKIPSFIEHISSGSFSHCEKIKSIEFPNDSKLQTINKNAFSVSTIKNIRIPSSVAFIGECAFHICKQLLQVEFPNDSKLHTIGKSAFGCSNISKHYNSIISQINWK